jgi:hypothetical protein
MHGGSSTAYVDDECWYAYSSAALSSDVITASYSLPSSTNFDGASIVVFGVSGFTGSSYKTNPWDPNSSLPAIADDTTDTPAADPTVSGVSTTNANDMIIGFVGSCR